MGSPPTALDSLVHLGARETRVRRLPPAYSLTSTSLRFFEGWPRIHLRYCRIRWQPQPKGWETMDPDEARRKFEESFFCANLDPGDPNMETRPTFSEKTKTTEEDIWDADLKQEEEKKVEIQMKESELQTIIVCRTIFDPFHSEKITGHIYGEKLQLRNHGDIIEVAIPTSIKERTLVWVSAADREWTTKSEPNQVFFESVKADMSVSGVFCLTAAYKVL